MLTGLFGVAGGHESPREFSVEVEEGICAVQVNRASSVHIVGQGGITEARARMVCIDIKVVVLLVGGAAGLEVEVLGGRTGDGCRDGRGSHHQKGCERLHYGGCWE